MNVEKSQNGIYISNNRNYLYLLIELALFIIDLCYYIYIDKTNVTVANLQFLTVMNIIYCFVLFFYCICSRDIQKHIGLMCFNIAFFILILGQYFSALSDDSIYGRYIFTTVSSISYRNEARGLFIIFVALFCISVGYLTHRPSAKWSVKSISDSNNNDIYGHYSLIIMYFGATAAFIKLFSKIYYVLINGYLAIYLNTGSAVFTNPLLDLFDGFYLIGFIGFIASFPSKDKLKKPLILFIVYSVLSLFTGSRGELVINILFIIWYLSKRTDTKNEKKFLSRKKIIIMGILSIFFISFLYTWGYSRVGVSVDSESVMEKMNNFIYGQGGSGHLISLSVENIDAMEDYISKPSMLLWPIENFLKNNSIIRIFTGGSLGQSATNIGSFGAALSYITNRSSYLNGAAVGTCYLAELFCSCGLMGVIIFNIMLGKFIKKMDYITPTNWIANTLFMKIFLTIIYLPRQAALQFIPECVITVIFVLFVSALCGGKRRKQLE